jgi:uncharacterized protein YdhG (YjbR/CyaY superfamily)
MMDKQGGFQSIDEYIATFPDDVQARLHEMRAVIRAAAPDATEKISYQMPTYDLKGNLVHFAAHRAHIGLYPAPTGIEAFKEAFAPYKTSKGAVQFPLDQPLPVDLITRVVQFRVDENLRKAAEKTGKRK